MRREQSTLGEARYRVLAGQAHDLALSTPLDLMDPATQVTPAFLAYLFDRLVRGELAVRADLGRDDPRAAMRSRAMSLSIMVLSLAVLMELTGEPVAFGLNLFTAEAALIAAGLGLLLPILRRLA